MSLRHYIHVQKYIKAEATAVFPTPSSLLPDQPLTMSVVSLLGVKVLNNPAPFNAPYEFEITFECLEQLREGNSVCAPIQDVRLLTAFRPGVEAHLRRLCHIVSCITQFAHT